MTVDPKTNPCKIRIHLQNEENFVNGGKARVKIPRNTSGSLKNMESSHREHLRNAHICYIMAYLGVIIDYRLNF